MDKKETPSLINMAKAKKIPVEFFEKCGFRNGKKSIEIHYRDKDDSPARTQFRNFTTTADRPRKGAFRWEVDDTKRIVPYGYRNIMNRDEIELLYLGEGATDGVTANYLGLIYAGFHG